MGFETAWQAALRCQGWLHRHEGQRLYALARSARGAVVEIGSFHGRSTVILAHGAREAGQRVTAVDPHGPGSLEALRANLAATGVADVVDVVVDTSVSAARRFAGEVDVLFVDGDHHYASVRADWRAWRPHLRRGARVAFHDTVLWPGPRRFVAVHLCLGGEARLLELVRSLTVAEWRPPLSLPERIANARQLLPRWQALVDGWKLLSRQAGRAGMIERVVFYETSDGPLEPLARWLRIRRREPGPEGA